MMMTMMMMIVVAVGASAELAFQNQSLRSLEVASGFLLRQNCYFRPNLSSFLCRPEERDFLPKSMSKCIFSFPFPRPAVINVADAMPCLSVKRILYVLCRFARVVNQASFVLKISQRKALDKEKEKKIWQRRKKKKKKTTRKTKTITI